MPSNMEGDYQFTGAVVLARVTLPASCVTNAKIEAGAGIDASKLEHLRRANYAQPNAAINFTARVGAAIIVGATGTLKNIKARNTTTASASDTTTVQLKKNGSNILSSAITLDAAATTVVQSGTFSSTAVVAGDVLEFDVTATGAAPGQGLLVQLNWEEDY